MSALRAVAAAPAGQPLTEQELAASSLALLAQPLLWPALRLPMAPASAAAAAQAPWTAYWTTRLDATLHVAEARGLFEAAFEAFSQRGDRPGELLCLAAVIESFYVDEAPLDPLDGWIAELQKRLPADGGWPSDELEARIIACGIGIRLRDPSHLLLTTWAQRGAALMRQLKPGAGRLKLATFLVQYHLWRGEFGRTGLIVDALPGLDITGLLPGEAIVWLESVAAHARLSAQHQRGIEAVEAALRLARSHGLREHIYALHAHGASLALAAHDEAAAQRHLDAMRPVLDRGPQADQTHYWHFMAGLHLLKGDIPHAVELARVALDNSGEIGGPYRSALHHLSMGQTLLAAGEPGAAIEHLARSAEIASRINAGMLSFSAALMHSHALAQTHRTDEALPLLAKALAEGARRDYRSTAGWWLPQALAALARLAIEHDIETGYVRRFVRVHKLPSPDPALAGWPWPLVLRGFGEFEATLNEQAIAGAESQTKGKTAQRPRDLLRALIAHTPQPLPVATVLSWLWPEADAAAQRKAFDVALLRLRRLLDDPRLIHLEGARLWLDARFVWSDVGALHELMHRIGSAHGATLPQLQAWGTQLLDLMRGPFLAGDDSDWVQAARQRYRQRFVITVSQLAARMEALDAAAAIRLYERALDVDPLAESLSRKLMRLHAGRGDDAEAMRVWRACCTMLSVAASLRPSRETQALARELGLAI
jgi:LuxR family transcriptional regulator, maltose regulon positive regulatory protein